MKCRAVIVLVILLLPIFPKWVFAAPLHTVPHVGPRVERTVNGVPGAKVPNAISRPGGALLLAQNITEPGQEAVLSPLNSLLSDSGLYEVRYSDTLWSLAKQFRPQGASVQQTMLAIMRLNAHAFEKNNGNRLNAGSLLLLPSVFDARSISSVHALEEIKRRYALWAKDREVFNLPQADPSQSFPRLWGANTASNPVSPTKIPALASPVFDGELIGQNTETIGENPRSAPVAGTSEMRGELTRTEAKTTKFGEERLFATQDEIRDAGEGRRELVGRIVALEATIADLGDLIAAQSTEIMALRRDLLSLTITSPPLPLLVPDATQSSSAQLPPTTSSPSETVLSTLDKTSSVGSSAVLESRTFVDKLRAQLDKLPGGTVGILGGAGALLIIVTLTVWLLRRRSASAETPRASTPTEVSTDELHSAYDTPEITQSVALSDTAPTKSDDVLAEANVYLAYERYEQAQLLVREALLKEPENSVLRFKLLEVLYHLKDIDAFREEMVELQQAQVSNESPLWASARQWEEEMVFAGSVLGEEDDSAFIAALELVDERSDESIEKEFTALFAPASGEKQGGDNTELGGLKNGARLPDRDTVAAEEAKAQRADKYMQQYLIKYLSTPVLIADFKIGSRERELGFNIDPRISTGSNVVTLAVEIEGEIEFDVLCGPLSALNAKSREADEILWVPTLSLSGRAFSSTTGRNPPADSVESWDGERFGTPLCVFPSCVPTLCVLPETIEATLSAELMNSCIYLSARCALASSAATVSLSGNRAPFFNPPNSVLSPPCFSPEAGAKRAVNSFSIDSSERSSTNSRAAMKALSSSSPSTLPANTISSSHCRADAHSGLSLLTCACCSSTISSRKASMSFR